MMLVKDEKLGRIIVVVGGVCSSLGKGVLAAALGRLLVDRGFSVANAKLDPYLNVDPGTMAPSEHGEVWVCDDGTECDLDLGTYERFTGSMLGKNNSHTAGQVYSTVLERERQGAYLGRTVQAVPHITAEIIARIDASARGVDMCIIELGGTVGDIEVEVFLEALRQKEATSEERVVVVMLALVPEVGPNKELKTKPAQHAVATLRRSGLRPALMAARSGAELPEKVLEKLSNTCGVEVVGAPDVPSVYDVVAHMAQSELDIKVLERLGIEPPERRSHGWEAAVESYRRDDLVEVPVGIVAKYTSGTDTYISVVEALRHAAGAAGVKVVPRFIDAVALEEGQSEAWDALSGVAGVLVPGGFGVRGVEGKVAAARWCMTNEVPYLGLCLGLQVAAVAAARSIEGWEGASSLEWGGPGPYAVVLMDGQTGVAKGGTMRLGGWDARIVGDTVVSSLYGVDDGDVVRERHRHRYEVNPEVVPVLEQAGLIVSGRSVKGGLVEYLEMRNHPFFVSTQAHPEFTSRPGAPNPLFAGFVSACGDRVI